MLVSVLREHWAQSNGRGLVFRSSAGTPLNTANVRNRVWIPLLERAEIAYRDLYSLRWTFVSMARASGEAAFNVSRLIGHARSMIVDTIYAHTVDSGLAGVTQSVEQRMGLKQAEQPAPTDSPRGPRQPPKLHVIEGGRRADRNDQRDTRRTIDDAESKEPSDATSN
jgi:hypothetical protein